jgi:hypothetical protein
VAGADRTGDAPRVRRAGQVGRPRVARVRGRTDRVRLVRRASRRRASRRRASRRRASRRRASRRRASRRRASRRRASRRRASPQRVIRVPVPPRRGPVRRVRVARCLAQRPGPDGGSRVQRERGGPGPGRAGLAAPQGVPAEPPTGTVVSLPPDPVPSGRAGLPGPAAPVEVLPIAGAPGIGSGRRRRRAPDPRPHRVRARELPIHTSRTPCRPATSTG